MVKETASELVYACPICGDTNFKISKSSGKYQCWSNGCSTKEIWKALAPQSTRFRSSYSTRPRKVMKSSQVRSQSSIPQMPPVEVGEIFLAKLLQPPIHPQPMKILDSKHGEISRTTYIYSQTEDGELNQWVIRDEWEDLGKAKGRDKTFSQWHRDENGKPQPRKGDKPWQAYRIEEAIAAIGSARRGQGTTALLSVEGEKVVEALRGIELAAITFQGSGWGKESIAETVIRLKAEDPELLLVILPDNDSAGASKAAKVQNACNGAGLKSIIVQPSVLDPKLPESGDVADILKVMETPEFIRRLEEEIHAAVEARRREASSQAVKFPDTPSGSIPAGEFLQIAKEELYGESAWICVDNLLHCWVGTYYKSSPDVVELRRIWEFCNSYAIETEQGIRYPYATPTWVHKILDWVKLGHSVDPLLVNPPGLNCTNGVLEIHWEQDVPTWKLVEHDCNWHLYIYEPIATYDPAADSTYCDRLLEALDAPQREIFLRTIAASLDLATVRQYKGRLVRAILAQGLGANGKDTLREVVAAMYGYKGVTGATLTDFAMYDQGRKFPLSRLKDSRVNWATENANSAKLDKIQSLKAFVTGDTISVEGKGKDEYDFTPAGIAIFNINDPPQLQASLEAITSRYAVLAFNKTFKIGADRSKGELEADPRFKYDPIFLRSQVLPAFLNRVLAALVDLMTDGIDYNPTVETLRGIQNETSHLWAFSREVGLTEFLGGKVYISDLWQILRDWYINNGTLAVCVDGKGKEKHEWNEQPRKGDRNVKGSNQIFQRFKELFPKIRNERDTSSSRKGQFYLAGIAIVLPPGGGGGSFPGDSGGGNDPGFSPGGASFSPKSEAVVKQSEAVGEAESLAQQGGEAGEAVGGDALEISGFGLCDVSMNQEMQQKNSIKALKIVSPASPSYPERVTAERAAPSFASPGVQTASPEAESVEIVDIALPDEVAEDKVIAMTSEVDVSERGITAPAPAPDIPAAPAPAPGIPVSDGQATDFETVIQVAAQLLAASTWQEVEKIAESPSFGAAWDLLTEEEEEVVSNLPDLVAATKDQLIAATTWAEVEAAIGAAPEYKEMVWAQLEQQEREKIHALKRKAEPVAALVNLLHAATTWAEVEAAIATAPELKQAAWNSIKKSQRERIYQLKWSHQLQSTQSQQKEQPQNEFVVGDRVTHADPYQRSSAWHGTIVAIGEIKDMYRVVWDEHQLSSYRYYYLPSDLRRL